MPKLIASDRKKSDTGLDVPGYKTTVVVGCPHCKKVICTHCWQCGADLVKQHHKPRCKDDPGFTCSACLDTGLNSKGGPCHPCVQHGRVKA